MQHLDDGTIHAWLDGALGPVQARHVAEHVAACGACADRVAEARGLIAASSRILMALDDVPANVVPAEPRIAAASAHVAVPAIAAATPPADVITPRARWWGHRYSRLAAVLAFVVAGTLVLTRDANRRDVARHREAPRAIDELRAPRDSAVPSANAPTAGPPVAPRAAPSAALGGASPRPVPVPSLKPQVKSFAQEARQQAAAAKKQLAGADVRTFGDANNVADTVTRAAQASSTLARRIGERGKLQLSEVVITGQSIAPKPPRLVSVDSVQRGGAVVLRRTYALESGTRVVLEVTPAPAMPNATAAGTPGGALTDSAAADSSSTALHSIQWRGADGTGYMLSGPVSVDELQLIRAALGKD